MGSPVEPARGRRALRAAAGKPRAGEYQRPADIGGELFELLIRCPNQGGNLYEGRLIGLVESPAPGEYRYSRKGEMLRCPWHGWEFDVRTGKSWSDPTKIRTKRYDVAVAPSRQLVEGPYVAETFAFAVEEDCVVGEI